ncbi:hypothetical protein FHR72_003644 [Mycolicibacterium iranicum]|uniref:Uncharacterized protein n=1 Tax=Mycolicibacterium iranicum TaxID=912594 RepID=A0A839Q7F4_MYCIR|nr:hypothetical protein [Mycolicibacterium iranicum]MBB2992148.1 hypothetical protein [Mycolicibacterium iranicum]
MHDTETTGTLAGLPIEIQSLIRKLRVENRQLRTRLRDIPRLGAQDLPPSWEKKLRKLRDENVQLRKERNEARADLAAARAERV